MKLLKSTILLQVAQCGWRDRWEAVQKKHNEKNQIKLDHGCIGALEALKTENPTEDGNWVCDDIFVPKSEYTCKNVCKADGKVSGEIAVKCRLGGTESKIRGYVDCPPLISDEQSRGMKTRRDKCEDNIIDIKNGELKFFRAKGVTKKEYFVWCGGKKSKIRVKCDEVRPNSHRKKWVFTKGKNADTACPNSGKHFNT
ncbi:unnamed protein product [Oikopleura dioica]|uniref:Uncharacterized protein n=1 Tax=Oikopleura dioica TaxID=34765 RepID=E4YMR4_OIKDI|nr:unnamed protein product [Oikopleura dioica]